MSEETETEQTAGPPARRVQAPELDPVARLGTWLAAAESGDPKMVGAAAAFRIYAVQRLGLEPWAALELSLIHGKLVASAKLKRALVERAGYRLARIDDSDKSCTAVLYRATTGEEVGRYTYTIEDAKRGGLVRAGSGYERNPERMLWARASTRVIDDFAPGVSLGIISSEDAAEFTTVDGVVDVDVEAEAIEFGEPLTSDQEYATKDELGELEHEGEEGTA